MTPDLLAPWVLTYLVHSTLLLAAVWLLTWLWPRLPAAIAESLWRTALLGGLLTASAQLAFGWEPLSGKLAVPHLEDTVEHVVAPLVPVGEDPAARPLAREEPASLPTLPAVRAEPPAASRVRPMVAFGILWLAVFSLLLLRARGARRSLRRRLAARRALPSGGLRERLDALCAAAGRRRGIALTESPEVGSPLALGILRPEIVVPERAAELSAEQQEAMLAHELAHLVRRDPLWLALARTVSTLLFFQPLNLLAARRLREASELLADAWAAERTGNGHALAECLARVAGWMLDRRTPQAAHAMAAHGSMLARRVEHLLTDAPRRGSGRARALAFVPVLLVAGFAPAIRAEAARAEAPVEAVARAATLDEEIGRLEVELSTLVDLLRQVPDPPEALRTAAQHLETRMKKLMERRVALAGDAQEMNR